MTGLLGKVCIKLLGREAGKTCIIADELEGNFVLIDGNVRRRKCNLEHLEISGTTLKIKKDAPTSEIHAAMKIAGIEIIEKKKSDKKSGAKPIRIRKEKESSIKKNEKTSIKKADESQDRNPK